MTDTPARLDDRALAIRLASAAADFAARALDRVPEETLAALAPDLTSGAAALFVAIEIAPDGTTLRVGYRMAEGEQAVPLVALTLDPPPSNAVN